MNKRNIEMTINGNKFTIILPADKYYDEIYIKSKERKVNYEPDKCYIEINNNIPNTDLLKIILDAVKIMNQSQKVYTGDLQKIKITFLTNEELGRKLINESPIGEFFDVQIKEEQTLTLNTQPTQTETNQIQQKVDTIIKFNKITKFDNGKMKTYIERSKDNNSTSYMIEGIDFSYFNSELETMTFEEKSNLSTKDAEEVANFLIDRLSEKYNLKRYYMRSAQEQSATNQQEEAALKGAGGRDDSKVNPEIGVREEDVLSNSGKKIIVTEQNGNYTREVAAQTDSINMTNGAAVSGGTSSENYNSPSFNGEEPSIQMDEKQQREILKTYYIQGEDIFDLVDGEFKQIGTLYTDGYYISPEGKLCHNNEEMGLIEDMHEIADSKKNDNAHIRTLKKNNQINGNISFGLVLMIIGLLSLMSVFLYYLLK